MKTDADSAHVPFPPPFLLLFSILIGMGLHYFFPLPFVSEVWRWWSGGTIVAFGIVTIAYCAVLFRKAHTALEPWKTTSFILKSGPYLWSRNPIYLCFIIIGLGVSVLLNNLWIIFMLAPLIGAINKIVIQREEKYLEGKFGADYLAYKSKVRKWI